MKYDDASWHYGGNFPKDLPFEAAATHIGMFVAWALLSGLSGESHIKDFPDEIPKLQSRSLTPGQFFLEACDGKFTDLDLNQQGNAFAQSYYEGNHYFNDYDATLGGALADLYHVRDSWENFDRLKPILDERFRDWQARRPN